MAKMALFSVIKWPCFQLTKTSSNTALGSGYCDLFDHGTDNKWWNNEYETVNW